jgi:type VI secretion system protein VasJ
MAEVTDEQLAASEQEDAPEEALSPFLEAVRAPISDADPVGTDVKYEDSFQQLKAEIDKVQSANADADFERIVELGKQILTKQSKDLTAAVYLGIGLIRTDGLSGLAEGVGAAQVLCETYWEDLYPPARRMVARKNALQLFIDRVYEWLEPQKPTKGDGALLEQTLAHYKALQTLATEKMEENVPVFSRVAKLLEAKLRAVPKDAPPPKPAAATGDGASSGTAAAPPASGTATTAASPSELRSPTEANASIQKAVAFLREQDKTAPEPFRLIRALRWGRLVEAPPAQNGKTLVEPYLEQRKDFLAGLLEKRQFDRLVTEIETDFIDHPFWLDLQRFLVTALDALGGPYDVVREGVVGDLSVLLHQFPELPSLAFSDGTPFADGVTREWIDVHVRSAFGGGGGASASSSSGEDGSAVDAAYADAREHLMKGDLAAAVATLAGGSDASGHERFRRQLYLASLCISGDSPAVARPILERLEADVETHRLDMWRPALALDLWAALYGCYGALKRIAEEEKKVALQQAADRVFERICATDPSRALTVMEQSKG